MKNLIIRNQDKFSVTVSEPGGLAIASFFYQPYGNVSTFPAHDNASRFIRMVENHQGLYGKYTIGKADGTPINPTSQYFVLRIDTDPAARAAMLAYAAAIENDEPDFAGEIREWVSRYKDRRV